MGERKRLRKVKQRDPQTTQALIVKIVVFATALLFVLMFTCVLSLRFGIPIGLTVFGIAVAIYGLVWLAMATVIDDPDVGGGQYDVRFLMAIANGVLNVHRTWPQLLTVVAGIAICVLGVMFIIVTRAQPRANPRIDPGAIERNDFEDDD